MKRLVIVSLVLVALGLVIHPSPVLAQAAQEIPFDSDLNFLRNIEIDIPAPPDATITGGYPLTLAPFSPGAPWAVCITPPGPNQVLFVADAYPGRVYKLSLDGTVLGYFGTNGKQLKQFNWIHAIACPSENEILVGELLAWRVQKLILKPNQTMTSRR